MKDFEEFLVEKQFYDKSEEKIKSGLSSLKNFIIDGYVIRASIHAASQAFERAKDMTKEAWASFFKSVVGKIKELGLKTGEYLFYSNRNRQGSILAYNQGSKELKLITTLPKGASRAKGGTQKLIIEGVEKEYQVIEVD